MLSRFLDDRIFTMFLGYLLENGNKECKIKDGNVIIVNKHTLNVLNGYCLKYVKRNKSKYLTLLIGNTFYRIGNVNNGRKLFIDAMRNNNDKGVLLLMKECEEKYAYDHNVLKALEDEIVEG